MRGLQWRLSATRHCSSASADRYTLSKSHTQILHQDSWKPSALSKFTEHGNQGFPSSSFGLDSQGQAQVLRTSSIGFISQEKAQSLPNTSFGFDSQGKAPEPSDLLLEIQNCCKEGQLHSALDTLSILVSNGFTPPEDLYWSVLKSCSKQKALTPAKQVYRILAKHGNGLSSSLLDYLVSTLAKCGAVDDALHLFRRLGTHRTIMSWTSIISAFTDCGKGHEALQTHHHMQDEGFQPNEYTLVSLLKACGNIPDLQKGMELHSYASVKGLDTQDFVGSALVSMYGKCRCLIEAEKVFGSLSKHNIVSWNAMLCAYAEQSEGEKVWQLYAKLEAEGIDSDERTFVILIQACGMLAEKEDAATVEGKSIKQKSLEAGKRLQAEVQGKGFAANLFVGNILMTMFGKCGGVTEAESVFLKMSDHTVISWTAMLSAYNEQDQPEMALRLFGKMQRESVTPNEWTFIIAIQACCLLAEKEEFFSVQGWKTRVLPLHIGRSLHADARKKGYDVDLSVGNMLVNLYGKCGSIHEAVSVFVRLSNHNVVLWNALLSSYVEQEAGDTALHLYQEMQEEGVSPDEQTSVIALQACSVRASKEESIYIQGRSTKKISLEIGRALHADAQRTGFDLNVFLASTLVSMYGKCGSILDAEDVFHRLPDFDVVSWTVMLSSYGEQGLVQKALDLYFKMQDKNVMLDDGTLVSLVQACRETGTLELCRQIHFDILASSGDPSLLLTTAFIHAYGSCASMVDAWAVFDVLLEPDVVSWSALIAGYAKHGSFASSFLTFECMKRAGIEPNAVTFLSLLSTCSHAGLVNKGVEFFESMSKEHGITPKLDHFATVVDLLGQVGDLERAEDMLSRLSEQPDLAMWLCLLGACKKHGNLALGERVFNRAVLLHPNKASAYVMMSNIYSSAGLWDCANELDQIRHRESARKKPGQSWIEHGHEVHSFVVGDHNHPQHEHLYNLLRHLNVKLRREGQLPYMEYTLSGMMEH